MEISHHKKREDAKRRRDTMGQKEAIACEVGRSGRSVECVETRELENLASTLEITYRIF